MHENRHISHYKTPPSLNQISNTIPTPQAILIAVTPASNARATPEIKSPAIKSLIPFTKDTPGSRGIIEPTINKAGVGSTSICDSMTPTSAIKVEAINEENAGIVLIFMIFL